MPVTPISAPFVLKIGYLASGLSHSLDMFCDGGLDTGAGFYKMRGKQTSNWVDPNTAVPAFCNLIKKVYAATDQFVDWVLFENVAGVRIPRNSGSLGIVGTYTDPVHAAVSAVHVFRDTGYHLMKFILLGGAATAVGRYGFSGLGTDRAAYVSDLLDTTTGHSGEWWTGRSFESPASFKSMVVAYNRKSRRRLGIE